MRNAACEFPANGFGPFAVERIKLRTKIIQLARGKNIANEATVHLNGCKAAGKSLLLRLIGEDLIEQGELVYYFRNAKQLDTVLAEIEKLDEQSKTRVFFLVDETQVNTKADAFTFLRHDWRGCAGLQRAHRKLHPQTANQRVVPHQSGPRDGGRAQVLRGRTRCDER